jgi:F0F1-type ATP synthase assembly protein I
MTACGFEKEVSIALREGRWPVAVDAALRQHAATCSSCCDVVLVTETLQRARAAGSQAAMLPSPGIIFWRAQLRRRSGAAERMTRPIVFAEVAAFIATLLAFVFATRRFVEFVTWSSLTGGIALPDWKISLSDVVAALPPSTLPLFLIGAVIVFALAGLAVYVLAHNE